MYLIIALGNPGKEYNRTRHNAGWLVVDEIAKGTWDEDKFAQAQTQKGELGGARVEYVKPQTFMNNSGKSVRFLIDRNNISHERVIILHDEIALPLGTFKISYDRGDGGHNGVASVIQHLRTPKFTRIRIGVGPTTLMAKFQKKTKSLADFVLAQFSNKEVEILKSVTPKIEEVLKMLLNEGREETMNRFN